MRRLLFRTVSAAFGGTTTVIPFCAQHRGDALPGVLADYHTRAKKKAVSAVHADVVGEAG